MKLFNVYSQLNLTFSKAKGEVIWTEDGVQYWDFYGGHAVISVGHSHPHYVARITQQLNQIGFFSNAVHIAQQQELANLLGKLSGYDDYQLFLCNSGAEANENALKVASFTTAKSKIVAFEGGFHGRTSGAVALTDNPKIISPFNARHEVAIIPYNLEALEIELKNEDVAAIIFEPIQGVAGIRYPENAFWEDMAHLAKKYGVLLIADEVQSGYGRTGKFFAHQYANIQPDIICMAKGMGNGFPIGGIIIHPDIPSKAGMLGTTYGGTHLACAAGIAVLEIIQEENLVQQAYEKGKDLKAFLIENSAAKEIRGRGLMLGIEYTENMKAVKQQLLQKHHILTGASGNKTLRILPPLSVSQAAIANFKEAIIQSERNIHE